jgi:predicted amidohydrolase
MPILRRLVFGLRVFVSLILASALAAPVPAAGTAATPPSPSVKIAILKLIPAPYAKAENFAKLEKHAREAAAAGAKILVSSECYLDGYLGNRAMHKDITPERLMEVAETIDGPYVRRAGALARELKVTLVFGFSEKRGAEVFNTAALFGPDGKLLGTYSKSHTGGELYAPGSEFPVFDTPHGRVGLLICYDRQVPETSRILAVRGAEMILIPAHSPSVSRMNEDVMMQIRAYENNVFIALANPFNALATNPDGEMIAHNADRNAEGILYAEFDPAKRARKRTPINSRRPEIYQALVKPN